MSSGSITRSYSKALDMSKIGGLVRDVVPQNLNDYSPSELLQDIYCLFGVAGINFYFDRPPITLNLDTPHEATDTLPQPPDRVVKKSEVSVLADPSVLRALAAGYETERISELPFYEEKTDRIPSLQHLGMVALSGAFHRRDDVFNSYLNARLIPRPLWHDLQSTLSLDLPVFKAALAINEGVFWKRMIEKWYPQLYCNPEMENTTHKSVFLQRWLADYISNLEPGNISYNDVKKNILAISVWIFDLDINGLKPPKYIKTYPPKRNLPEKEWEELNKETCVVVDPYPDKMDISQVLKCLSNLRRLSLCYGFENYERDATFSRTRVTTRDIESLGTGLTFCKRLISLRLHKSSLYSQDVIALCSFLSSVPIKRLEISSCFIDNSGCFAIAKLLRKHEFLEVLDLKWNRFSENGVYYLSMALIEKNTTPLRSLDISYNGIGNMGALYVGLMLSVNRTLGSIGLVGCGIGQAGERAILTALERNELLLRLDLTGNAESSRPRTEYRAFNRSYTALRWLDGDCGRYRLAQVGRLEDFPSYDYSQSDTESELTEPAEPQLPEDETQVYIRYLEKKATNTVNKGLKKLYSKGTPLMKLINSKTTGETTDIIKCY